MQSQQNNNTLVDTWNRNVLRFFLGLMLALFTISLTSYYDGFTSSSSMIKRPSIRYVSDAGVAIGLIVMILGATYGWSSGITKVVHSKYKFPVRLLAQFSIVAWMIPLLLIIVSFYGLLVMKKDRRALWRRILTLSIVLLVACLSVKPFFFFSDDTYRNTVFWIIFLMILGIMTCEFILGHADKHAVASRSEWIARINMLSGILVFAFLLLNYLIPVRNYSYMGWTVLLFMMSSLIVGVLSMILHRDNQDVILLCLLVSLAVIYIFYITKCTFLNVDANTDLANTCDVKKRLLLPGLNKRYNDTDMTTMDFLRLR